MKYVPPSLDLNAFNCPYCRAFAHQDWFAGGARHFARNLPLGDIFKNAALTQRNDPALFNTESSQSCLALSSVMFSKCASCHKVTVWVHDRIVFPQTGEAPAANPDMPDDIRRDYDEASTILDQSPRGAAALIRLAIQKLCKELGQPGKNINDDIGALVRGGLDPRVQQALDAVRVIGNSAVHPGQIDLRDDRATAETLFKLLNLIVDKTISEPKHVAEVYASLP
ncbi:DUF4145 domain-containing protein [Rhodovulum adriaticum]|nr:DUF4145 domain-containing protein [Rhodovulum adriaticum]